MQIGKSLIWEEIETGRVDLGGTRVGEELQLRLSLAISGSQMK
jgi:hypothetical protein